MNKEATEMLARMAARATVIVADCDEAIRDIDYLATLHQGKPEWAWLANERDTWVGMREPVQRLLEQCRERLAAAKA